MKTSAFVVCVFAALLVVSVGCGLETGYNIERASDVPLLGDLHKVTYRGNGVTTSAEVHRWLLRRCAEVTIQSGRRYFAFLDSNQAVRSDSVSAGIPTATTTYVGATAYTTVNQPVEIPMTKFTESATIKTFAENPGDPAIFDAAAILAEYEPKPAPNSTHARARP